MTIKTVLLADVIYDDNGNCDETGVDPIVIFRYDASNEHKFQKFMSDYTTWINRRLKEYYNKHGQNVYCPFRNEHEKNIKEFYANVTQTELFRLELITIDGMEYVYT